MNKAELVEAVASAADIEKSTANRAVQAVLDSVASSLQKGDPVVLVGFGTFAVKERSARVGRNPKTGVEIKIPASRAPVFKPGKVLKDALN